MFVTYNKNDTIVIFNKQNAEFVKHKNPLLYIVCFMV